MRADCIRTRACGGKRRGGGEGEEWRVLRSDMGAILAREGVVFVIVNREACAFCVMFGGVLSVGGLGKVLLLARDGDSLVVRPLPFRSRG